MPKRLVLAGAGHAHIALLAHLDRITGCGHEVTVIGPGDHHYYSGMGPGVLGGAYDPDEIRFPVREMTRAGGGRFVVDSVRRIDPTNKVLHLASGAEERYDVLSCNTGSRVPELPEPPGRTSRSENEGARAADVYSVKPIENLVRARERLLELAHVGEVRVGVCGGGPAAAEIAANVWSAAQQSGGCCTVRLYAGRGLLPDAPDRVRRLVSRELGRRSVDVVSGSRVSAAGDGRVVLEDGRSFAEDMIFLALGVAPSPLFADSGLPTGPEGGLLVNEYLQQPQFPDIFGGGDCIFFRDDPLDKVGVYAVREGDVLEHNLLARLEEDELRPFDPGGDYLLVYNLGDGVGVLHKRGIAFDGRLAFRIKDWIDRRFMRAYLPGE